MRNYLKAELFRNFKRMYLWTVIACLSLTGIGGCLVLEYWNNKAGSTMTLETVIYIGINFMSAYIFAMVLFTDISIGEEIKNNTIKNIVSSGLSRTKMYVAKVIEAIILMSICSIAVFAITIIAGYIILGVGSYTEFMNLLQESIMRGSVAILLWSGAIALSAVLNVLLNGTSGVIVYIGIVTFLGNILQVLGRYMSPIFAEIHKYLISTQLSNLTIDSEISTQTYLMAGGIGLVYVVILTIVGIVVINKKDI